MELITTNSQLSNNRDVTLKAFLDIIKKQSPDRFTLSVANRFLKFLSENLYTFNDVARKRFISQKLGKIKRINNYNTVLNKIYKIAQEYKFRYIIAPKDRALTFNTVSSEWLSEFKEGKTKRSYQNAFNKYQSFVITLIADNTPLKDQLFKLVDIATVKKFKAYLENEKASPFTINQYLSAVKSFCKYVLLNIEKFVNALSLTDKEANVIRLKVSNINTVKAVKINNESSFKGSFTLEELKQLISVCTKEEAVILGLSAYLGFRAEEVRNASRSDFTPSSYRVKGKGQRTYKTINFMPSNLWKQIESFNDGKLFPSLTYAKQIQILDKAMIKANISKFDKYNKKRTLHSLRHSFVQILVKNNMRLEQVKHLARHKSYNVTELYFKDQINKVEYKEAALIFSN